MFNGYNYPWTNLHDVNLDWLLKTVKTDHDDVQQLIAELRSPLPTPTNVRRIFTDKRILVVGDSISNTPGTNWPQLFQDMVSIYGATVTNNAVNGDSFAGQKNNGYSQVGSGFDMVIVFLGVNDWHGQYDWTPGSYQDVPGAVNGMINAVKTRNPDALYYYVSPIKNDVPMFGRHTPLNFYRGFYEKRFSRAGFQVIAGYNLGAQGPYDPDFLVDGLHPTPYGCQVIARYILDNICMGTSTFTPCTVEPVTLNIKDANDTIVGYIDLAVYTDGQYNFKIHHNALHATAHATTDVYQLPYEYRPYGLSGTDMMDLAHVGSRVIIDGTSAMVQYLNNTASEIDICLAESSNTSNMFTV